MQQGVKTVVADFSVTTMCRINISIEWRRPAKRVDVHDAGKAGKRREGNHESTEGDEDLTLTHILYTSSIKVSLSGNFYRSHLICSTHNLLIIGRSN